MGRKKMQRTQQVPFAKTITAAGSPSELLKGLIDKLASNIMPTHEANSSTSRMIPHQRTVSNSD